MIRRASCLVWFGGGKYGVHVFNAEICIEINVRHIAGSLLFYLAKLRQQKGAFVHAHVCGGEGHSRLVGDGSRYVNPQHLNSFKFFACTRVDLACCSR